MFRPGPVDQVSPFPLGAADDQVMPLRQFAALAGISIATLRRRIAAGDGPIITRLSQRRLGVRLRHGRQWLDARSSASAA